MGYYDEDFERQNQKRTRQRGVWFTSFISAIIGGLVVFMLVPALANFGMLPYDLGQDDTEEAEETIAAPSSQKPSRQIQAESVQVSSNVIDIVENVSDAIVGVINIQAGEMDFFSQGDPEGQESGTGSGVVFDVEDGRALIVTNYHVIEGANSVEISLANGEREEAELIGADPLTDLAVLSIDDEHVTAVAEFGDSDALRTGEPAIAIGNPLGLDFSRTVTQGVISGLDRSIEVMTESGPWELTVIQTDAAINPGNSGGALLNVEGQVIGINSLKIAEAPQSGGMGPAVEGMGFAIPSNEAVPIINDLIEHGEVQRPQMGVSVIDLALIDSRLWQEQLHLPSDITHGVVVRDVQPASPAEAAGLESRDVIVEIDGEEIENGSGLRKALYTKEVGDTIEVKLYRGGLDETLEVELDMPMETPGIPESEDS
jgi:serine protease Do